GRRHLDARHQEGPAHGARGARRYGVGEHVQHVRRWFAVRRLQAVGIRARARVVRVGGVYAGEVGVGGSVVKRGSARLTLAVGSASLWEAAAMPPEGRWGSLSAERASLRAAKAPASPSEALPTASVQRALPSL